MSSIFSAGGRLNKSAGVPVEAPYETQQRVNMQLDVVFPANPDILARLESLETSYSTGRACLTEVLSAALGFVNVVEGERCVSEICFGLD